MPLIGEIDVLGAEEFVLSKEDEVACWDTFLFVCLFSRFRSKRSLELAKHRSSRHTGRRNRGSLCSEFEAAWICRRKSSSLARSILFRDVGDPTPVTDRMLVFSVLECCVAVAAVPVVNVAAVALAFCCSG